MMLRIGWFSSGRDEAARQLLQVVWEAVQRDKLKARLAFVFCNREPGESPQSDLFLKQVKSYSLPLVCLSSTHFREPYVGRAPAPVWRQAYDRQVMSLLEPYLADLGVLAGYMLILSPEMCQKCALINLHPAAPSGPQGTWQQVIWQLIEKRAKSSGLMMHLVTPELDQGPPVTYATYSLRSPAFLPLWRKVEMYSLETARRQEGENLALFHLIRQEGLRREFPLILATLQAFCQGRVAIKEGRVVDGEGEPIPGYDLTAEIESPLES